MKRKDYEDNVEFMDYLWDVYSQWRTNDFIEDKIENMTNRELKNEYEAFLEMKKDSEDDRMIDVERDIEIGFNSITSFSLDEFYLLKDKTQKQRQAHFRKKMNIFLKSLDEYTKDEKEKVKQEILKKIEKVK